MYRVILTVAFVLTALGVNAQVKLDTPVEVSSADSTLGAFINRLAAEEIAFFGYNSDKLDDDQPLQLTPGTYQLQGILDALRDQLNLDYTILSQQIVLKPQKAKAQPADNEAAIPEYTISGLLKEKSTGELLIGGTVLIKELGTGVVSNNYGFYSLTLPKGKYTLVYGFFGLADVQQEIDLGGNFHLDIDFEPSSLELDEVIVSSEEVHERLKNVEMSSANADAESHEMTPGPSGEVEVIKSLSDIAGVTSHGDGSVYFYVRGGGKDQNLILLDEAPIYNTSHMFGFFSTFSHHAIKEAKLHKADIPIQYGGMIASVLDIKTRDGHKQEFHGFGNISPFATTLSVEGPIRKNRSSYFVLARRSHMNGWLEAVNAGISANFSDFNTKLNFTLGERDKLFINLYAGRDRYWTSGTTFGGTAISWENAASTARWNHIVNDRLFTNTTLYSSHYRYWLYNDYPNDYWLEDITNVSIKTDWSFYMTPKQTLRFGAEGKSHYFNPGNYTASNPLLDRFIPDISHRRMNHFVWYMGNEHAVSEKLKLNYGARLNRSRNIGASTIYSFDDDYQVEDTTVYAANQSFSHYVNLEPRVSGRYRLDSINTIKASYGRNVQYLHLLSNTLSPFTALDVWMPSGPNIEPVIADQWVLGYYRDIKSSTYELTTEVYYKQLHNQIDYEPQPSLLLNPLLEGELRFADGYSTGAEITLEKKTGKTTGTVSYNYSKTRLTSPDLNNGKPYKPYFDRPSDFVLNLQRRGKKRWTYGLRWQYTSGLAFSSPVASYEVQGKVVPYYGERNNDRLPAYHRMDLTATWVLQDNAEKRWKHYLMFSLYNVYNRHNPISISFNKAVIDDQIKVPVDTYEQAGLQVTSQSIQGTMPTINYTFKF